MKDFGLSNDLQEILTQAIKEMEQDAGHKIEPDMINLAELARKTNLPCHKLRRLKKDGFAVRLLCMIIEICKM